MRWPICPVSTPCLCVASGRSRGRKKGEKRNREREREREREKGTKKAKEQSIICGQLDDG